MDREQISFYFFIGLILLFFVLLFSEFMIERYNSSKLNLENLTYNSPNKILPTIKGDILTNNLTIICVSGYSSTVRDVPQKLREKIFLRDNVSYPQPTGEVQLDHLLELCLGGSNSEENLWVQFAPYYQQKDKLEKYLCKEVCKGKIDINYAQQKIMSDWYSYYKEVYE